MGAGCRNVGGVAVGGLNVGEVSEVSRTSRAFLPEPFSRGRFLAERPGRSGRPPGPHQREVPVEISPKASTWPASSAPDPRRTLPSWRTRTPPGGGAPPCSTSLTCRSSCPPWTVLLLRMMASITPRPLRCRLTLPPRPPHPPPLPSTTSSPRPWAASRPARCDSVALRWCDSSDASRLATGVAERKRLATGVAERKRGFSVKTY